MLTAGQVDTRVRKKIGKYTIVGRIGKGGMGMVYRGLDETLDREVAVKTLTVEGTLDEESRKRFEIEAKAVAKLQHPNIVTVFELGEERGLPYIAMELLPGVDLESLLRSGDPLVLPEKLDILIQVCRGLQYAHEHRIVHRDVKPSNIRLLEDGTVKIMDFGIAKLGGTGVTKTGIMLGTVHYMSPEQIHGKPLDGRSDVFSTGVILHEMLTGQRPFQADTMTAVLYKIVDTPNPRLPDEVQAAAPGLQEIVDLALAKDPGERYPSAARLADDLGGVRALLGRGAVASLSPDTQETVNLSRRLLKEGQVEECLRRIQEVTKASPDSLEARRVLRAAHREMQRRQRAPEPAEDLFPELEATYQAAPTQRSPDTEVLPTQVRPTSSAADEVVAPRPTGDRGIVWAGAAVVAVVLGAGAVLVLRGDRQATPASPERPRLDPRGPVVRETGKTGVVPTRAGVLVITDPAGAAVALNGRPVDGVTPLRVDFDAGVEHRLSITREGHAPQDVRLVPGQLPAEVRLTLEPAGPLGRVEVASSYPVDVLWKGRALGKGQASVQASLPVGRQTLTLVSSGYFLRVNVPVDVRASGVASVVAPGLGKIHIRANPDNCQVFIDGMFVEYPPILDRAIAAGSHRVSFAWPDGARSDQTVEVVRGSPAYVMGRRD